MSQHEAIVAEIPRLRRYARALTGDAVRADDLVQDTLERALGKWSLWRPGKLGGWLFSIMHNIFVSQMRRPRPIDFPGDEVLPDLPMRAPQGDALELRDLANGLAQLPVEQREVLLLVGLENLSYEDTAKALGIPVGTVMSRLSRGRERLRVLLAGGEAAESRLKMIK